jgi:hypothetical protein
MTRAELIANGTAWCIPWQEGSVTELQGIVLGGSRGNLKKAGTDRKLDKPQVAIRENVTTRTLERWVEGGDFPAPDDIINGRWMWWLSTLQAHDRRRMRVARKMTSLPQTWKRGQSGRPEQ